MTHKQAVTYLNRAEKSGYVRYHSGIVRMDVEPQWSGNTTGSIYGINIDGDGFNGRLFGCPCIIWDIETAEMRFPTRKYSKRRACSITYNFIC